MGLSEHWHLWAHTGAALVTLVMVFLIQLGIGRIVFRALHTVEVALVVLLVVTAAVGEVATDVLIALAVVVVVLGVQLVGIRPVLNRRSDRVLAGETLPRSSAHAVFVVSEVLKAAALVTSGVLALSAL